MTTIVAVFENGVFKPERAVDLSPGTRVEVILPPADADPVESMRKRFPLSFGAILAEDADEMTRIIEAECERIDLVASN